MNPYVDPAIAELTAVASKPIIERGIKKLGDRIVETEQEISGEFEILSKETAIYCLERVQKYSAIINLKKVSIFKKKIEFKHGKVRRCSIRPWNSLERIDAIALHASGFTIDLGKLQSGEKYILEIEYELEDDSFLDSIVDRAKPRETPGSQEDRFWLVAALKHLDVIKEDYNKIDLYDLDFRVNVAMTQDLNTKIPKIFKDQIEQLVKVAGPLGRDELFKEYYKLRSLKMKEFGRNSLDLLGRLQELFLPTKFSEFINVKEDFRYGGCERGVNEFNVQLSWPRSMVVISRTDLSLDKPAAHGTLIFKKSEFLDEVGKIFS
ncbi:MAG: hypothetical protein QXP36_10355 [Conexivisphaerales archaeon]